MIGVHHDNQTFGVSSVMKKLCNHRKVVPHRMPATALQIRGNGSAFYAEQGIHDDTQRRFVGGGFAQDRDAHQAGTGTPPKTPLYQTSPSGASPMSSRSSLSSLKFLNVAMPSLCFSAIMTCSGWSLNKSRKNGE